MAKKPKKKDKDTALVEPATEEVLEAVKQAITQAFEHPTILEVVRLGVADGVNRFLESALSRKGKG